MALFSKEPEKNPKIQPTATGPTPVTSSTTAPLASPTISSAPSPAPRANAPLPAEGRACLDRGSKITGKVSFEGPARIDGEVDGEISAKDSLMISETAIVTAQIRAGTVSVAGKVSGDIVATQRIEIRANAKMSGNLTAPILVVQEGAFFEGHCSMQPEGVREDRKITVFPKEERVAQVAGGQKQG
jgi:cytoskeletal protein CcmA (bactofilin family)